MLQPRAERPQINSKRVGGSVRDEVASFTKDRMFFAVDDATELILSRISLGFEIQELRSFDTVG